jgi:hypothetical protein
MGQSDPSAASARCAESESQQPPELPARRRARTGAVLTALAVLAAACSSGDDASAPTTTAPPPETTAEPTTTRLTTTTSGVPRTTTTIPLEILSGAATLSGTVVGPQGTVIGAIVRVERLVGSEVATMDVSAATGSFSLVAIRGGRYRVRAWKTPDLVQTEPVILFLAADETKSLELRLIRVSEVNVQTTVTPNPPPPGEAFTISLFVYAGSVTDQGVVQASGRAGQEVQIILGPGLLLEGAERQVTDGSGRVSYRARCVATGPVFAELALSPALRFPVTLPNCPG